MSDGEDSKREDRFKRGEKTQAMNPSDQMPLKGRRFKQSDRKGESVRGEREEKASLSR